MVNFLGSELSVKSGRKNFTGFTGFVCLQDKRTIKRVKREKEERDLTFETRKGLCCAPRPCDQNFFAKLETLPKLGQVCHSCAAAVSFPHHNL